MEINNLPEGFELVEETQDVVKPSVPDGFEFVEEDEETTSPELTATEPTKLTQPKVEEVKPIEIEDKEIKVPEQEEEIKPKRKVKKI